jgi:peptidyl-tRNA hydrolase, PTH1 family
VDTLYLIAGLGNPGREYQQTRHNAGFLVADRFAETVRAKWSLESRFKARVAKSGWAGKSVLICQPLTFMNASGESVAAIMQFFRVPVDRLIVVVDDADLTLGTVRLRPSGSSGGHHGLDSIEQHLGTREYARQRVGISRLADGRRDIAGHVLGSFSESEREPLKKVLDRCVSQLDCWLTEGLPKAMSQFNGSIGP